MELSALESLERQVTRLLEGYRQVRTERDDLAQRVIRLEAENTDLRSQNDDFAERIEEARRNTRDPVKEERIRAKVDELLAKLEGF
ncbi:MAG: hypothetical protein FJY67_02175 [Calditrichaeota bacterium]|nr:hypothetical protein [Calditrichota bacterium]